MSEIRIAALQMVSAAEVSQNLKLAEKLIGQAADAGAVLAALPENFAYFGRREADKLQVAETPGEGPIQSFLAETAKRYGIALVGGTLPLRLEDETRAHASSLAYDADGRQIARYDKLHLFDVGLPDANEEYRESDSTAPGSAVVLVDTPAGKLGLSVCYDLRFPELYRRLSLQGAQILCVPSAFTATTGRAHWQMLLQARAVENLCYVLAPNQGGSHEGGRETWGHSMIVGPWGEVLASVESGPGVAVAAIDTQRLGELRRRFPALSHRREDIFSQTP